MFAIALMFAALSAPAAGADSVVIHIVRQGDTLASIAERYYGNPQRENVLVVENGLTQEGGSEIVVGMRLIIPVVYYYRVQEGETWTELAKRFYGDARRAFILFETNSKKPGAQPDPGYELLIPYPLRYVVGQNDSLRQIAKIFYSDKKVNEAIILLMRFNFLRRQHVERGQIVLVPLSNLVLSEPGRKIVEQEGKMQLGGQVRDKQTRTDADLVVLREHLKQGRYAEAVALGNRLLGVGDLSGNQLVTIQRELASAFVALSREDLAIQAFKTALQKQPDLELDTVSTSPKVLRALQKARQEVKASGASAAKLAAPSAAGPGKGAAVGKKAR